MVDCQHHKLGKYSGLQQKSIEKIGIELVSKNADGKRLFDNLIYQALTF